MFRFDVRFAGLSELVEDTPEPDGNWLEDASVSKRV
jgi:hypothetical protein